MGSSWVKPPKFEITLLKRGLEPNESESILLSKLSNIFEHQNVDLSENDDILETVKDLRKKVCFRENISKSGLDQRNVVALRAYVDEQMLPGEVATPMQLREETTGQRGLTRFDRQQVKLYHDRQHSLFSDPELLREKFCDLFPLIVLKEKDPGFFYHQNGVKFTTEDACRVIDKFTSEFIKYLILVQNNGQVPPEWAPQNIPRIRSLCLLILMGRRIVDWANDNDLLTKNSYEKWKNHVWIEMSYAALVVVLDLILNGRQVVVAPPRRNNSVRKLRLCPWCVMYTVIPKVIGFAFVHYSRY